MTDRGQMNLFGRPPAGGWRRRKAVGPAPVSEETDALAKSLPETVRLGTSSWSFPGWEGIVYDREATQSRLARDGLAAYAQHPLLRAVGIDRTYYGPLPAESYAEYAAVVPEEFRFLVKAASQCTTPYARDESGRPAGPNPLWLDSAWAADEVVAPYVEGLGERAGALVFQFPPLGRRRTVEPGRFAGKLAVFLGKLPPGPLYAVELRDRELLTRDYVDALASAGATHCFGIHSRMPSIPEQREIVGEEAAGPLVARWMLHAGLDYEGARRRYEPFSSLVDEDPSSRSALANLCLDHALAGKPVIVTANNKAEGSAPLTLFRLAGVIVEIFRQRGGERR